MKTFDEWYCEINMNLKLGTVPTHRSDYEIMREAWDAAIKLSSEPEKVNRMTTVIRHDELWNSELSLKQLALLNMLKYELYTEDELYKHGTLEYRIILNGSIVVIWTRN